MAIIADVQGRWVDRHIGVWFASLLCGAGTKRPRSSAGKRSAQVRDRARATGATVHPVTDMA
ncbi:hypothetical protein JWH11_11335 [Xanthomonas melonis]|uniref:Uncharacterized protein n=1 Tax=Xanthomonas melonis TaxID=56456 RepID=A0ABS8NVB7_9XANT|nr:hypothetical protein [Xanthomonas melonis]MCD0260086.1 hypothetical protein [Xanthomonas melonis]MCD0267014.1 hypothetical protein [Xanthomonas melonis]